MGTTLETLPAELELSILRKVNFDSLKTLVHASPTYHALYVNSRLEILTSATLRQLIDRNINIEPPLKWLQDPKKVVTTDFNSTVDIDICAPVSKYRSWEQRLTLLTYYQEAEERWPKIDQIRLSVEECKELLKIYCLHGEIDIAGGGVF